MMEHLKVNIILKKLVKNKVNQAKERFFLLNINRI